MNAVKSKNQKMKILRISAINVGIFFLKKAGNFKGLVQNIIP